MFIGVYYDPTPGDIDRVTLIEEETVDLLSHVCTRTASPTVHIG